LAALGIDVEPREILPEELLDIIATPREQKEIGFDSSHGRLLFAAKEAVYKAFDPLERMFLDHHDVEVDFIRQKAIVSTGRTLTSDFRLSTLSSTVRLVDPNLNRGEPALQ
jgi:4'-phosphopantetheinyl transferase EntD